VADSVRIRHRIQHSGIALVPIPHKPLYGYSVKKCPTCQIIHTNSFGRPVKTVHLYLDDTGSCLVSRGVFEDLRRAGMPNLDIIADIVNPPPIMLGANRFEVDQNNAKIRFWKEPVIV
jgi:hypothetical protein